MSHDHKVKVPNALLKDVGNGAQQVHAKCCLDPHLYVVFIDRENCVCVHCAKCKKHVISYALRCEVCPSYEFETAMENKANEQ